VLPAGTPERATDFFGLAAGAVSLIWPSFTFFFREQFVERALVGVVVEKVVQLGARLHRVDDALLRAFLADRIVDLERGSVHGAERREGIERDRDLGRAQLIQG